MGFVDQLRSFLPSPHTLLPQSTGRGGLFNFTLKDLVASVFATVSVGGCNDQIPLGITSDGSAPSEVPYYGRSPAVYPSRESQIS